MNQQQQQRKKKKTKTKQGLTQGRTTQRAALEFFTLYFLKVTTGCSAGEGEGGGYYSEIPFFFFWITTCARVCHYVGRVGPPDWAPSLMYVCLQPPPTHTHPHAEMRSDRVMNVSAVLCTRVCVCVCVSHTRVWSWASECVCVCALRGYRQGMGGHPSVLPDWLIGGVVYIVSLCPAKRNRPPADCSLSTPDTQHTHTLTTHTHTHTHHYSPCFGKPCYYADTLPLSHSGRLTSRTEVWCFLTSWQM